MPVSAATLRALMAAGVTGDALVTVVEHIDADMQPVRSLGAERQARYRARIKARDVTSDATQSDVTPPQEAPETKVSPTPPLKTQPQEYPPSPPTGAQTPTRSKAKPLRPLPEDWAPSSEQRARWKARGATDALLDSSAEDMRTWANGKGVTRADWAATFDGFVKRDLAEGGRPRPASGRGPPRAEPRNPFLEALERIPDDDSPSSSSNDPADLRAPRDLGPPRMAAQRLRAEEWEDAAVARQGANRN